MPVTRFNLNKVITYDDEPHGSSYENYLVEMMKSELLATVKDKLNFTVKISDDPTLRNRHIHMSVMVDINEGGVILPAPVEYNTIDKYNWSSSGKVIPPPNASSAADMEKYMDIKYGHDGYGNKYGAPKQIPSSYDIAKYNNLTNQVKQIEALVVELNDSLSNVGSWVSSTEIKRISNKLVEIENMCDPNITLDKE